MTVSVCNLQAIKARPGGDPKKAECSHENGNKLCSSPLLSNLLKVKHPGGILTHGF